jgi:hypothetical protein
MNQRHRNDILLMFNVHCNIMCVLRHLVVWNDLIGYTQVKLVSKQHVLFSVCFRDCSIWEQHHPWCAVRVHLMSAISLDTPSPSWFSTSRNPELSSLANGLARPADLHNQSNDFHSTVSSTVWLVDQNDVECVALSFLPFHPS